MLQPRLPLTGVSRALRARNPERVSKESPEVFRLRGPKTVRNSLETISGVSKQSESFSRLRRLRLFRTLFGPRGRSRKTSGDFVETLSGFWAWRARETPASLKGAATAASPRIALFSDSFGSKLRNHYLMLEIGRMQSEHMAASAATATPTTAAGHSTFWLPRMMCALWKKLQSALHTRLLWELIFQLHAHLLHKQFLKLFPKYLCNRFGIWPHSNQALQLPLLATSKKSLLTSFLRRGPRWGTTFLLGLIKIREKRV